MEIDSTLQRFGAQHSPDHACADPHVSVHIDDGRAFLQQTDAKYDLILVALPDSLTLVSGASSPRRASHLFTLQAAQTARAHLARDAAFAMYDFYRQKWIVDRLARTLDTTIGHSPCVFARPRPNSLAVLTVGLASDNQHCAVTWKRRRPRRHRPATIDRLLGLTAACSSGRDTGRSAAVVGSSRDCCVRPR